MQWWHKRGNFTKYATDFFDLRNSSNRLPGCSFNFICHGINAYYFSWMKANDCVDE